MNIYNSNNNKKKFTKIIDFNNKKSQSDEYEQENYAYTSEDDNYNLNDYSNNINGKIK